MKDILNKNKKKLYAFFPPRFREKAKSFYYDNIIWPLYCLRNKFYYGQWDFFEGVEVETTTYCNFRCKFCPNSKYDRGLLENKKLLDEKLFKKIVDELAEIKYRGTIFPHHYGEPLTDERIFDLILYAKEKIPKGKVRLHSNGALLTLPIYRRLNEAGIDSLFISQYTDKMLPNVKEIFEYLNNNKKENKAIYRVFTEEAASSNRGGEIKITKIWGIVHCAYPDNNFLTIDYKGDVSLCCNDYHSSIIFGNIKNEKLVDIWNKTAYKKIRKELRKYIYELPICKRCVGLG